MGQGFSRLWGIFLAAGVARQWRGQQLYFDAGDSYLHHIQLARGGIGEVDQASRYGRASIINADLDSAPIGEVGHQSVGAKGRRPMGCDQLIGIENLPARRAPSLPLPAIPGGHAVLDAEARCRGCIWRWGR